MSRHCCLQCCGNSERLICKTCSTINSWIDFLLGIRIAAVSQKEAVVSRARSKFCSLISWTEEDMKVRECFGRGTEWLKWRAARKTSTQPESNNRSVGFFVCFFFFFTRCTPEILSVRSRFALNSHPQLFWLTCWFITLLKKKYIIWCWSTCSSRGAKSRWACMRHSLWAHLHKTGWW